MSQPSNKVVLVLDRQDAELIERGVSDKPTQGTTFPPIHVALKFCSVCGRTDRSGTLRNNHFSRGQKCPGTPETLRYDLAAHDQEDN